MEIADSERAERKLSQIGYYRLSGFWYSCRELVIDASAKPLVDQSTRKPRRLDRFMPGTSLERTTSTGKPAKHKTAGGTGRRSTQSTWLAAQKTAFFGTRPTTRSCRSGSSSRHGASDWHRATTDCSSGATSNRCAHHSRIWNYACKNPLPTLPEDPFMEHWINLPAAMQRVYGMAVVIARLMTTIGPNSSWFREFATLLDSKPCLPGCDFTAAGLPDPEGFPHHLFSESSLSTA